VVCGEEGVVGAARLSNVTGEEGKGEERRKGKGFPGDIPTISPLILKKRKRDLLSNPWEKGGLGGHHRRAECWGTWTVIGQVQLGEPLHFRGGKRGMNPVTDEIWKDGEDI